MALVPFVAQCPEPVETANLHFKSLSKLKVFNSDGVTYDSNTSLLAVSRNYGLTFVGTLNGFLILKSKHIFAGGNIDQYQREIVLNSRTTHIATDHEDNHLAAACQTKMGPILYIYNIHSFLTKGVSPIKTVPLSKPFQVSQLCELLWQPNSENGLTVCFTDGSVSSLSLFQGSGNEIFSLPPTTQARCLCWSPKGKQLVIGCNDGSLSQYKPDLKFVKKLSPPPLYNGAVTVVNVLWISNFQFLAAYKDATKTDDFAVIVIVNAPKNEPIRFINYDDITYSTNHFRPHQFYFHHILLWNLIFMASANSMEVAVLHAKEDNSTWEQWLLGDASRAELPLDSQKSETFPLGMAFDYTSDQTIPWGEGFLSPMPVVMLLSSEGLLITFNVINASTNANKICSPSEKIFDDSWFMVKEKSTDAIVNQPTESSPSQGRTLEMSKTPQIFSSTFAPLTSVALTPQQNVTTATTALDLKLQPLKQQAVPPINQEAQGQAVQFPVSIQSGASTFQNPNSPPNCSQKPPSSSLLFPKESENTTVKITDQTGGLFAAKPAQSTVMLLQKTVMLQKQAFLPSSFQNENGNMVFKSAEQSGGVFAAKPPQSTQPADTKDWPGKSQKSSESSVETKIYIPGSVTQVTTPVSGDVKGTRTRTPETSPNRATPEVAAVDDTIYVAALWDEIDHFNVELKEVISRVSTLRVRIGAEEEKTLLRNTVQKLKNFQAGVIETTTSQKNEIHAFKSDIMEAFAWLEDARSRNRQRKSPTFIELKKSQDLDPMSSRLMSDINHLQYYIENQLKQLYSYLWKEWMEHQDSCRLNIKTAMTIPSMEELYKTLHLELKILNKQRTIVEELRRKLKEKNVKNSGDWGTGALLTSSVRKYSESVDNNRVSELFKLADNLLQIKIDLDEDKSDICVTDAFQVMVKKQISAIAERTKKFTPEKQNILRDILSEREMLKTRSVKSNFMSSSFIRNASLALYTKASERREREAKKASTGETPHCVVSVKSLPEVKSPTTDKIVPQEDATQSSMDTAHPLKPAELFMFSVPKSTTIRPVNEDVTTDQRKTTPFVFKASPVTSVPVASNITVPKSVPTCCGVTTSAETSVAFAFKFTDVPSTVTTASTFSFTANKTSSAFTPRTDVNFPGFSVPQAITESPPTPSVTVFSFASTPTSTTSESIFGNTTNLFPFSGSLTKSSSGNCIFSSSEIVSTPTTRSKSVTFSQTSVAPPGTPGVVVTSAIPEVVNPGITPVETTGRSSAGVFATAATCNAPLTTTVATISAVATTAPVVVTSCTSVSVPVPVSPNTECRDESHAESDTYVPETSGNGVHDMPEDVKSPVVGSDVIPPHTAVPVKTEAESSTTTSMVSSATTVFSPSAGIFSMPSSTIGASPSGNIFGQSVSAAATTASIFSMTTSNISSSTKAVITSSPLFSTPTTAPGSIFGQPASTTPSTGNIFGQVTSTTAASTFGQPTKDEVGQTAKLFGDVLGSSLSSRNIFETPTSTTASGSIFAKPTFEKSRGSIFGNAAVATTTSTPTGASAGIFGSASSNIFSKGLVPQSQMPTSTSSGIFGQPQNTDTGSTFFGQNICSTFGASASNQNPFASATGFNTKPVFGQNLFGQSTTGQNPFERSQSSSIFGGSPSTTQNVFQSGSSSFGGLPPGPFSGGQSTTGPSGIGSSPAFQKPMGGSIFGSSPSFTRSGATPTFGGAPTFGSPATFGTPQKVFGSPQGTFGQNQTSSPTFGALANQTDGFANLALQSQNQSPAFGGNTFSQNNNFGGESEFGGTSFSSWRS